MENINLIHGDCLEEMKKMPDKSVDLVVTSPPYNQGLTTQDKEMKLYDDSLPDGDYIKMIRCCFNEIMRLLKDDGSFLYN